MKVRRILALVLSAALAVTALTACTSAKDEASQKSADNQTATLSYDTVKIGVIHIGNPADRFRLHICSRSGYRWYAEGAWT